MFDLGPYLDEDIHDTHIQNLLEVNWFVRDQVRQSENAVFESLWRLFLGGEASCNFGYQVVFKRYHELLNIFQRVFAAAKLANESPSIVLQHWIFCCV